jgi:hypothetical protein
VKTGVWTAAALLACFCTISCGNKLQTREAVERGIRKSLSQRSGLNVNAMDISVASVTFKDNRAETVVNIAPKGQNLSAGMTMHYTLEQKDGEWSIVGRSQADMGQHMGRTPGANPHGDSSTSPIPGALPPGHPAPTGTQQ